MPAPQLTQYITGQGSVTGDQLNTFLQTADNLAQLRALVGTTGMQVYVRGAASINDGGQGNFYWNPSAVGPDNNFTIIIPPAAASGGWVRLVESNAGFFYAPDVGAINALVITLTLDLSALPVGSIIIVNPAHTTTITNPTLSVNGATGVVITTALGTPILVGAIVQNEPAQLMVGPGQALWLLNPGGSVLGPYATAPLGQLPGTITNDNANPGAIGEFIAAQTPVSGGVLSGGIYTIADITLTEGDWDVWGTMNFAPGPATDVTIITAAISTINAGYSTFGPETGVLASIAATFPTGATLFLPTGMIRQRVAFTSLTIMYLIASASFTGAATMPIGGFIAARRVR